MAALDAVPEVVSAALHRNRITDTSHSTESGARLTGIESDGAGGYIVTFSIEGTERKFDLTSEHRDEYGYDRDGDPESHLVWNDEDGTFGHEGHPDVSLWGRSGTFTDDPSFEYLKIAEWRVGSFGSRQSYWGYSVWGDITESRPSGSLSYEGRFDLDGFRRDDQDTDTGRSRYEGSITLTADLDGSALTGSFEGNSYRPAGESEWSDAEFGLAVTDGRIVSSGLQGDLTGSGLLADFTGSLSGHFYGPSADEIGGTVAGEDPERIFIGFFGGDKE